MGFTINGLSVVQGTLSAINPDESAGKNLEAAAAQLESEIKQRAPVDTGHLRGSYDHVVQGNTAFVGTNVEYAAYQEYMYTAHVRPALDDNRRALVDTMAGQTLRDAFDV